MRKVSVFKTICWFIVCCALFGVLNEIAYNLFFGLLSVLSQHIKILNSILSKRILFQAVVLVSTWQYGALCSLISFAILPKNSLNVAKALFGTGIAFIIFGVISLVVSAVGENFLLCVSEIIGGYYLIRYGKNIENI